MFTILIPTYERYDVLKLTLNSYLNQCSPDLISEIIVVDDGSKCYKTNKEIVDETSKISLFPIKYVYQENKGPAEARNTGIKIASGDIILITGDDIIPHKNMVKQHFFSHKKFGFDEKVSVLGKSIWPDNINITPFMEYIQEYGLQFGYSIIPDENNVPFNFFYTSNISIHKKFLLQNKLFDTDFPYAVWEDIELAYRLKNNGLKIVYNKEAIGYHFHEISFSSFRKRQERCGYAAYIFYKKHPELKDFLGLNKLKNDNIIDNISLKIIETFCLYKDKRFKKCNPKFYDLVMDYYYKKGIRRYLNENKL